MVMEVKLNSEMGRPVDVIGVPSKYIVKDGVRHFNPDYKAFMAKQGKQATTALHADKALPTVCTMGDFEQLKQAAQEDKSEKQSPPSLAPSTEETLEIFQDDETFRQIGLSPEAIAQALGGVFAKYEIPIGMMNKLLAFSEFDKIEFEIDDSGSMGTIDPSTGISRWQEAKNRLKMMIEIMAYVPIPLISISFLNRKFKIEGKEVKQLILEHEKETPERFIEKAYKLIDQAFASPPGGSTPILEYLTNSLAAGKGKKVARYLFCDGVPDGGGKAQEAITQMLKDRPVPQDNPVTLISCSETASDVKWMKEAEETADYCSEYDDFQEEVREVAKDQGDVFPFTFGMYLVGQLVGAMNPDDLDAMDESVPFTKMTLDNLLGVNGSVEDYRRYFDGFKYAQEIRPIDTRMDQIKKQQQWEGSFHYFLYTPLAKDIQAVKEFKRQLEPPPAYEPSERKRDLFI